MVKHIQTIRRQQPTNCLSMFGHFVGLSLKGLINFPLFKLLKMSLDVCCQFFFHSKPQLPEGYPSKHFGNCSTSTTEIVEHVKHVQNYQQRHQNDVISISFPPENIIKDYEHLAINWEHDGRYRCFGFCRLKMATIEYT